jgi:hypothetical protein
MFVRGGSAIGLPVEVETAERSVCELAARCFWRSPLCGLRTRRGRRGVRDGRSFARSGHNVSPPGRSVAENALQRHSAGTHVVLRANSIVAALNATIVGMGVAVLPCLLGVGPGPGPRCARESGHGVHRRSICPRRAALERRLPRLNAVRAIKGRRASGLPRWPSRSPGVRTGCLPNIRQCRPGQASARAPAVPARGARTARVAGGRREIPCSKAPCATRQAGDALSSRDARLVRQGSWSMRVQVGVAPSRARPRFDSGFGGPSGGT